MYQNFLFYKYNLIYVISLLNFNRHLTKISVDSSFIKHLTSGECRGLPTKKKSYRYR